MNSSINIYIQLSSILNFYYESNGKILFMKLKNPVVPMHTKYKRILDLRNQNYSSSIVAVIG